ncbi:OmpA family protein [Lysobacter panacisoli]|uniref:OmpA-like domain-containing protein n=1 Tax=Lysobacter panacisoli TaxID=1255263 RepID=A0ABP9L8P9_9GAMM|nr:OmpA family protein [Lysobacter panacisoli]
MLDALIRQAAELGMGDKAKPFVRFLADSIFDEKTGGFAGFRHRFEQAGLGSLLQSWIGTKPGDNVLQPDQFSAGFGQEEGRRIARQLGVAPAAVNMAGAQVLPKLIGLITSDGRVPTSLPAHVGALLQGGERRQGSGFAWLKWLVLAGLLVLLFLLLRNCHRSTTPDVPNGPGDTASAVQTSVAQTAPQLQLETADGGVKVSGTLVSETEKSRLWDALTAQFGADKVSGDIVLDPQTMPAGWMDKLIAALPQLKADGLKFGFDGDKLSIDTSALPEAQRFEVSQQLRSLFGGYAITGLWERATAALASLKAGFSAEDLVKALNLMNVYFDTGSNAITADSMDVLQRAAEAIKSAPSGSRIEVGGHSDNTGSADINLTVSQKRADAVVAKLVELGVDPAMLSAKGYGQDKPIADNTTEEGRAKNRRIEFTVLK